MQAVQAVAPKKAFANDGSYESVELMLLKQARVYYTRIADLDLPIPFDEVLGVMRLGYAKAREKWKPDHKAKFNTYCFIVCRNEFNAWLEPLVRERASLGMYSVDDRRPGMDEDDEGSYDRFASEGLQFASPEQQLEQAQEAQRATRDALARMAGHVNTLTPAAQSLLKAFVANRMSNSAGPELSLKEIAEHHGLVGPQFQSARRELAKLYDVDLVKRGGRNYKPVKAGV